MERITRNLVAPCGMNCGICTAYLRRRNPCPGCRKVGQDQPQTRAGCRIRTCTRRRARYCFSCDRYPCDRLLSLDRRYRTRYGMSEMENLEIIRSEGIDAFVRRERERWQTARGVRCVHDGKYY